MKYLIVGEEEPWIINCSPDELEQVIKNRIADYSIHEGDRIYVCEYLGMVEKEIKFNFKPKEQG